MYKRQPDAQAEACLTEYYREEDLPTLRAASAGDSLPSDFKVSTGEDGYPVVTFTPTPGVQYSLSRSDMHKEEQIAVLSGETSVEYQDFGALPGEQYIYRLRPTGYGLEGGESASYLYLSLIHI